MFKVILILIFNNKKYNKEVVLGALANFAIQLNSNNKISFKNIINVNTNNYVIERAGKDYILGGSQGQNISAFELGFKQNIFFNTQLLGEHNITGLGGSSLNGMGVSISSTNIFPTNAGWNIFRMKHRPAILI